MANFGLHVIEMATDSISDENITLFTEALLQNEKIKNAVAKDFVKWLPKPNEYTNKTSDEIAQQTDTNFGQMLKSLELQLKDANEWIEAAKNMSDNLKHFESLTNDFEDSFKSLKLQSDRLKRMRSQFKVTGRQKTNYNNAATNLESKISKENESIKAQIDTAAKMEQNLAGMRSNFESSCMKYFSDLEKHENALQNRQICEQEMKSLRVKLDQEKQLIGACDKLLQTYSTFKKSAKSVEKEMKEFFGLKWNEHESNWLTWKENDIVLWFKYKLGLFDLNNFEKSRLNLMQTDASEDAKMDEKEIVDFDQVFAELKSKHCVGKYLATYQNCKLVSELGISKESDQKNYS